MIKLKNKKMNKEQMPEPKPISITTDATTSVSPACTKPTVGRSLSSKSFKKGIGHSPLTDRVYIGKQDKVKGMWIGDKEDITSQFIAVSLSYFEENTIREIGGSQGSKNLVINIKKDKSSIERVIKNLTKQLGSL